MGGMQMKDFHLVTDDSNGNSVEIDFNEYELLQMISLCLKRRYNKGLGIKFAKIYLEALGREGRNKLNGCGVDPETVEAGYEDLKKFLGSVH